MAIGSADQRRQRRRVSDRETQLQLVTDHAPVLLAHCDRERRYRFVNRGYAERFGLTPEQVIGRTIPEVVGHEAYASFRQHVDAVLAGERVEFEVEVPYDRIGSRIMYCTYVPELGPEREVAGFIAAITDVTDRKRAEEALRKSEERFRSLSACSPVGIFTTDTDGGCTYSNPRCQAICGFTFEQALGREWCQFLHPDDRGRVLEEWSAKARAAAEYSGECRFRHPDGSVRCAYVRTSPMLADDARLLGHVGTVEDITARKEAEAALEESARQKDEFLAVLAHELRNPLAPIRTALELMRLAAGNPAVREKAHTVMARQLKQLVRLVDDLLDVSRITRGKIGLHRERVDVGAVIQNAVETSRPFIEAAGHDLTVTLPPEPVYIDADPTRLAQVFANLLNNAAKYTDSSGAIHLAAERHDNSVTVRVRDTGIGIPADMLSHIFEMFTQVDRSLERTHGGLGIGLTLAKRLVEMHGGTIEARSEGAGCGSEFIVQLPAVAIDPAEGADKLSRGAEGLAAPPRRILVVDDNRDAADSLALALQIKGHQVRTAHDGVAAIDAVAEFRPDVVLLDIGMPRLNGHDVARHLRHRHGTERPVLIALTGWGQDEDRRRSHEAGFDHHLVKPADPAVLEALLASIARPIA
jgi:two-component system, chemotaxis family, CheB/CheR fusion protein